MLIKTDESAARLKPEEVRRNTRDTQAAAIREQNQRDRASIPKDGVMDVTKDLDRVGAPMFTAEFIKKLKTVNANFHYETSLKDPSIGGIYLMHPRPLREDGERRQFICRCETVLMPEYQIFKARFENRPDPTEVGNVSEVPIVDDMVWGWRTVLARLIRHGFLTQAQSDKTFGLSTKDSERWQLFTGQTVQ